MLNGKFKVFICFLVVHAPALGMLVKPVPQRATAHVPAVASTVEVKQKAQDVQVDQENMAPAVLQVKEQPEKYVMSEHEKRLRSKYREFSKRLVQFREKRLKENKIECNDTRGDIVDAVMRVMLKERILHIGGQAVILSVKSKTIKYNKNAEQAMDTLIELADHVFKLESEQEIQAICVCLHIYFKSLNFEKLAFQLCNKDLLSRTMAARVAIACKQSCEA